MTETPSERSAGFQALVDNRSVILFFSVLSMVAVANLQYGWTLFVSPLQKHLGVEQALIQVTFTVFVLLETWLVPFEGWLVDKFGPKLLVMAGGVLAAIGWYGAGKADSLTALYLSYAIAGLGAGIVYGTAIGSALKWFPDHRGLAAGLTAAGFGAGAAFTVAPIANMISPPGQPAGSGYQHAFIVWGIIQGAVVIIAALFLKAPPDGWLPKTWRQKGSPEVKVRQSPVDFKPGEMASTPHFWLMYGMMAMVATGGLMATAQLAPMAKDFGVDKMPVQLLCLAMPALVFALSADRLVNGLCRPFWGRCFLQYRTREDHDLGFRPRGDCHIRAHQIRAQPEAIRDFQRLHVLRMGRDLFALSGALWRLLRPQVRHNELRLPIHR